MRRKSPPIRAIETPMAACLNSIKGEALTLMRPAAITIPCWIPAAGRMPAWIATRWTR